MREKRNPVDVNEEMHAEAMLHPRGIERALIKLADAVQIYAAEYEKEVGMRIGDDAVLGEAYEGILEGFKILLNGPSGRLSCGKFDTMLRKLAAANNTEFPA